MLKTFRCFAALQAPAVSMPNELTVSHFWRDEKRPREYDFDAVFGPQHTQVRTLTPRQLVLAN
jgi:hypothetical protein